METSLMKLWKYRCSSSYRSRESEGLYRDAVGDEDGDDDEEMDLGRIGASAKGAADGRLTT